MFFVVFHSALKSAESVVKNHLEKLSLQTEELSAKQDTQERFKESMWELHFEESARYVRERQISAGDKAKGYNFQGDTIY